MISTQPTRNGISVIEVLTSIVVAMIGVFGVLAMIPFAVQQTQSGLDRDGATVLARNGMAEMEIRGYRAPENWAWENPMTGIETVDPAAPQPFSIDPLAVLEYGSYALADTGFPVGVVSGAAPNFPLDYKIYPANLVDFAGNPIQLANARRMFRARDELNTGELTDEMVGPNPLFDANATTDVARRQTVGSLSWSVLMLPHKPPIANVGNAWTYRSYVIVYKDRLFDPTVIDPTDPEGKLFSARLSGVAAPGETLVSRVDLNPKPFPADYPFAKGDWVMLINKKGPGGGVEVGFEYQVGFYRLINYTFNAASQLESVTLDGPDFDFNTANAGGTQMVHLRDVIAVYERDIVHEEQSTWNLDRN